ncbi:T9SS type A sorting domain-containing protein [Flammeovirga yaeyamensis]|uniref:T9SS type A sorting domain-containing protein n=1 Tax=Flammeovirga yaeyamensis TaxID=367791 RepID=A0AAX1MXV7_9BACT|nr:T9SS type A sorting domain-containing protein [Flammeovirga yaeyamensis]MBB3696330.1 Leucine-rich repeat (LRR) protein [Flammeovirga yaeyamensis]NMF35009.1 T9SS type A sorting domain-containing protein [Flammeovirga yaeyamensis]QWG00164.1 T9SS type A sorting domain-containing protein [Flammeovirga yaeyamensis]
MKLFKEIYIKIIFLIFFISFQSFSQSTITDSLALVELFNQNQNNTLEWDLNKSLENWEGVILDGSRRVTTLNIPQKNITIIPINLGDLSELKQLLINRNEIRNLPSSLGKLTSLTRIHLADTKIESIDDFFISFNNLNRFDCQNSEISYISPNVKNLNSLNIGNISNNRLSYSSLNNFPESFLNKISYSPQRNTQNDTTIFFDNNYTIDSKDSLTNNNHQWYKNKIMLPNENNRYLTIYTNGDYQCVITNSDFSSLTEVKTANFSMVNSAPFKSDSLALESLSNNNPSNNLNWSPTIRVKDWTGVTHTGFLGDQVTKVDIDNQNLSELPTALQNLTGLDTLILSNNRFVFDKLYATQGLSPTNIFTYSPQANLGTEKSIGYTGTPVNLEVDLAVTDTSGNNIYQWYKDGQIISGANQRTYSTTEIGTYHCEITNSDFPILTLRQNNIFIFDQALFDQDSTIVRSIYENNPSNTLGWSLSDPISQWNGVNLRGGRVNSLHLSNTNLNSLPDNIQLLNKLDSIDISYNTFSALPTLWSNLTELVYLDVSHNQLTSLVDEVYILTQLLHLDISSNQIDFLNSIVGQLSQLDYLNVSNNNFTFDDLLKINKDNISNFTYSPQGAAGPEQFIATAGIIDISVDPSVDPLVSSNQYQWFYERNQLVGETSRTYTVDNQFGVYHVTIMNSELPSLLLRTSDINVSPDQVFTNDSLALITLMNENSDNTLSWNTSEPVGTWEGIKVDGYSSRVFYIDVWSKNITNFPSSISTLDSLKEINFGSNDIESIDEDFYTNDQLEYANFSNNHLPFSELDKVNIDPSNGNGQNFVYQNQKAIGVENSTVTLENGVNYLIIPDNLKAADDQYQWYRNGNLINNASNDSLWVNNIGEYNYTIKNSRYPNELLTSFSITVDGEVTSTNDAVKNNIKIYPNPTDGVLIIKSNNLSIEGIQVRDIQGKLLDNHLSSINSFEKQVNIENYPSGVYMISIHTDKGSSVFRVIKK